MLKEEKMQREKSVPELIKCLFGSYRGTILGHVVSSKGIEMTDDKVKAILRSGTTKDCQ